MGILLAVSVAQKAAVIIFLAVLVAIYYVTAPAVPTNNSVTAPAVPTNNSVTAPAVRTNIFPNRCNR